MSGRAVCRPQNPQVTPLVKELAMRSPATSARSWIGKDDEESQTNVRSAFLSWYCARYLPQCARVARYALA